MSYYASKLFFQPICLPSPRQPSLKPTDILISAGWGHLSFGGMPSQTLMRTKSIRFIPSQECDNLFKESGYRLEFSFVFWFLPDFLVAREIHRC